jgi:hypothetical protein
MRKLVYILLLSAVGLVLGVSCESTDGSGATAQSNPNAPPEKVVHGNTYEDEWKFTHNGFTLEKLYDSYDVENKRYSRETNQSYLDIYKFERAGMEYLVIKDYNDDNMEVVNVTKDSLICAQLARKQPVGVSPASPISEINSNKQEDWYKN